MPAAADAVTIQPFDIAGATEPEYRALNDHTNRMKKEVLPDDPPTPLEERIAQFQNIPPFVSVHGWAVWNAAGDQIVASANVHFLHTGENEHVGQFGVEVEPDYRRRGLGRGLLGRIADETRRRNRRLMITGTNGRVPAGAAFLERMGGERSLENHTNQLALADLDRALVREWIARAPERAPGFALGLWEGPYSDEAIVPVAELMEVMNSAPRGSLDVEDFHWTPEQIRQMEQGMFATGTERWTLYAREESTGRMAGFTEVTWNPNRPELVYQGGTGVFPEFRSRGLGRWLKAAMLEKIVDKRPGVRFVRTGNADTNAPMLKINYELGFKPYLSQCLWQVATDKVFAYLEGASLAAA